MIRKVISAMILMGAAGAANATIMYVDPTSPTMPIVHPPQQTDWSQTYAIAQYNPADHGGIALNSVHIEDLIASLHSNAGVVTCFVPGGNGNCEGNVNASVNITLTGPAGLSLGASASIPTFSYNFAGNATPPPFTTQAIPGADVNSASTGAWYCIVADMAGCQTGALANAIVAAFQGSGTVALTMAANGVVTTTNTNGSAGANYPLDGDGRFRVRYDYDQPTVQTPEPATLGLIGLGLAGFAASRRKKQA